MQSRPPAAWLGTDTAADAYLQLLRSLPLPTVYDDTLDNEAFVRVVEDRMS